MPENKQVVKLLSGTYINYFHCKTIIDILKETEADSKNIFGYYSSQRMKDWQDIERLYEKQNVYLAEAAQILQRMVEYEIPAVKRQIKGCQTTAEEFERKEHDYERSARDAVKGFEQECLRIGIRHSSSSDETVGDRGIRSELRALANDIPSFLQQLTDRCQALAPVRDHYLHFRAYLLNRSKPEPASSLLALVDFLLTRGNVTYYEFRTGKPPLSVETLTLTDDNDGEKEDEIDFGGLDDEINFDAVDDDNALDFGIETVADSVSQNGNTGDDGVARGADAFSILENATTQRRFLTELYELEAFLKCRLLEFATDHPSDILLAAQRAKNATAASYVGETEIGGFLTTVGGVIAELTDSNRKHLFRIRTDDRYLQSLTDELMAKRDIAPRNLQMATLMREKQQETRQQLASLRPKLELVVERTKELRNQIQEDISKRYQNRQVNIMGAINAALV